MRYSLQDIFAHHFDAYAQGRTLHPREWRAAQSIRRCHRPEQGWHLLSCPEGHYSTVRYHACRHRSCPRCALQAQQQWLAGALPRLLPCPHFHVVFTLPHELVALWQLHRAWFNQLMFDCARQSLLTLCADPRHLGATPGLLMALHTWGRTLSRHPHVHCLVTAGGLDAQQQWRACRSSFLVPLKPLQQLFRAKMLSHIRQALHSQRIRLPANDHSVPWAGLWRTLWLRHWNVHISAPYDHGRGVAQYLARYVRGGPLGARNAIELRGATVHLPYIDHHDGHRKNLTLPVPEFIHRVLCHAPPRGQHTVRQAGLYASTHRAQLDRSRASLTPPAAPLPMQPMACHHLTLTTTQPTCPICRQPLLRRTDAPIAHQGGEISIPRTQAPPRLCSTHRSNGRPRASPSGAA